MTKRKRRVFTPEFKADAVRLCTVGGRSIGEVAKQFDLEDALLRKWVRTAKPKDRSQGADVLSAAERTELAELRKRVKRLEMERDILKKATSFFARENA